MYGKINSIAGTCYAVIQRQSFFFVIACESVGTVDSMCFPSQQQSAQG